MMVFQKNLGSVYENWLQGAVKSKNDAHRSAICSFLGEPTDRNVSQVTADPRSLQCGSAGTGFIKWSEVISSKWDIPGVSQADIKDIRYIPSTDGARLLLESSTYHLNGFVY